MAKGRPDWTSSINITGQDLEEVISRPKYGAAESALYSDTILEGDTDNLFDVSGTGMIYGGYIAHGGSFDPTALEVYLVVDGAVLDAWDLFWLNYYQIVNDNMSFVYEQYYSTENEKYIQGITHGITFEERIYLTVTNNSGSGGFDSIDARLMYALI